uniref:PD-(D/E)XK nuclease superfamily protein n=1 Tax=Candidatus Kentrum sp. SD TaxID=2126332 RepID=A0A450YG81_9GAMM|nr:MAG: hypothetical protein BECKSD772F_GA0070984_106215 [Candidatus Kentron sp. SD]VFK46059.1 MAG: hypothetical protein BECKSD772E_GA0070983_106614 [Candidatus Kentron sp. SD]VFK79237.1 MAG: hypothetical protein BECKSD772D_GA0070982_104117 [Candidatus Kentron sp. SD]
MDTIETMTQSFDAMVALFNNEIFTDRNLNALANNDLVGLATYSLQNHLRTTVRDIGQVEIDEICVGIDKRGAQFVLPVQAKGGADQLSVVQAKQDMAYC